MGYNLFLDDFREPHEVGNYILPVNFRTYYRLKPWVIVRNYAEFVTCIEEKGMPDIISFDHDLADEHYTPEHYWDDYDKSKEYQESREYTEKTGLGCAEWLVNYCMDKDLPLPKYFIHSMNPVGADNIKNYLENYLKVFGK
jgi:hypothetical protein